MDPERNSVFSFRDAVLHLPSPKPHVAVDLQTTKEPGNNQRPVADYCDFPFLKDASTKEYIMGPGTKIMFVLRGAPGSGKSFLKEKIEYTFPDVRTASADFFWIQPNGEYKHDVNRLQEAHEFCRSECERYCRAPDTKVVIVDNTNSQFWEFRPYIRLAHRYNFIALLVEPKTPWRYNANELFKRNTHNVPLENIEYKCRKLQEFIFPMYYGWFLNVSHSGMVRSFAANLIRTILKVLKDIPNAFDPNVLSLASWFAKKDDQELSRWADAEDLFHCTAFFTGYGRILGAKEYGMRPDVEASLGKKFTLSLTGLLITNRTISFRVSLSSQQLTLWNNEDQVVNGGSGAPRGDKAHITVAKGRDVSSSTAGEDMVLYRFLQTNTPPVKYSCPLGEIETYVGQAYYLKLGHAYSVPALFAAFYSR